MVWLQYARPSAAYSRIEVPVLYNVFFFNLCILYVFYLYINTYGSIEPSLISLEQSQGWMVTYPAMLDGYNVQQLTPINYDVHPWRFNMEHRNIIMEVWKIFFFLNGWFVGSM